MKANLNGLELRELKSVPKELQNVYVGLIMTYKNSGKTEFNICLKNDNGIDELLKLKVAGRINMRKIDVHKYEIDMLAFMPYVELELEKMEDN